MILPPCTYERVCVPVPRMCSCQCVFRRRWMASAGTDDAQGATARAVGPYRLPRIQIRSRTEKSKARREERSMADAASYEEQRRRQIEANKRKLEELQLHHLSAAVREAAAAATKPSPAKKRKPRVPRDPAGAEAEPLRRSGRVASLPEKPTYREVVPDVLRKIRRTTGKGRRTDLDNRVYATEEEREYAITMAEELEGSLGSSFPSFVKPMSQSHVTGGFWLGLPIDICRKHLPKRDERITLVDEEDNEFETLYLALKRGLSAGWRGFSIEHELVDGDCLVFELVEKTRWKVYIIRASSYENGD